VGSGPAPERNQEHSRQKITAASHDALSAGDFKKWRLYFVAELLESPFALNQIDDEDDESNYKQEMDQAAANVAEQTEKPENQQDDNYSPQHM